MKASGCENRDKIISRPDSQQHISLGLQQYNAAATTTGTAPSPTAAKIQQATAATTSFSFSFWPGSDSHRKRFVVAVFSAAAVLLPPINTIISGNHLTFLTDSLSSCRFLIDSGSLKSVIPNQSSLPPTGPTLYTVDDKPIATWGFCRLPVQFGDRSFHFHFCARRRFNCHNWP
jgi:hypothetical protein